MPHAELISGHGLRERVLQYCRIRVPRPFSMPHLVAHRKPPCLAVNLSRQNPYLLSRMTLRYLVLHHGLGDRALQGGAGSRPSVASGALVLILYID